MTALLRLIPIKLLVAAAVGALLDGVQSERASKIVSALWGLCEAIRACATDNTQAHKIATAIEQTMADAGLPTPKGDA